MGEYESFIKSHLKSIENYCVWVLSFENTYLESHTHVFIDLKTVNKIDESNTFQRYLYLYKKDIKNDSNCILIFRN